MAGNGRRTQRAPCTGVLLEGTVDWETNGEGLGRGLGKARWDVSWSA